MPKNLVVCCDGTANEFAADKTNVIKLYQTLIHDDQQVSYYKPGIGTMEHPGTFTNVGRWFTRLLGQAIGFRLENDIRDAYVFLMRNFEPGDRVYLFGFSRGAFTARAVASVLHMYGLIRPGHEALVPYAIRMMTSVSKKNRNRSKRAQAAFALADQFKDTFCSTECKPHFVGVWDTVSSVGWIRNPLKVPFIADNPDIQIGRHAISIDEHRAFFRTNLWRPSGPGPHGPLNVKQVWFAGVHCDVGGGYPEAESGLSKVALEWMLCEAKLAGLRVDPEREALILGAKGGVYVKPDPKAKPHRSLTPKWYPAEFVLKRHFDRDTQKQGWRMNLFRRRRIDPDPIVHQSVIQRGADYVKRVPVPHTVEKTACGERVASAE